MMVENNMLILATTEREYPWGTLRSTNASKVKVILEEKGLAYRVDRLRPGNLWKKPPEMLAKHPLGKVPYLETEEDGIIFDSSVVNEYLDDRYPDNPLKPDDPVKRARMRMLENFGDEAFLVAELARIWMPMWSPPEDRDQKLMQSGREALKVRALPYLEQETGNRANLSVFVLAPYGRVRALRGSQFSVTQMPSLPDFGLIQVVFENPFDSPIGQKRPIRNPGRRLRSGGRPSVFSWVPGFLIEISRESRLFVRALEPRHQKPRNSSLGV